MNRTARRLPASPINLGSFFVPRIGGFSLVPIGDAVGSSGIEVHHQPHGANEPLKDILLYRLTIRDDYSVAWTVERTRRGCLNNAFPYEAERAAYERVSRLHQFDRTSWMFQILGVFDRALRAHDRTWPRRPLTDRLLRFQRARRAILEWSNKPYPTQLMPLVTAELTEVTPGLPLSRVF